MDVFVDSEYGPLCSVVMRYAGDTPYSLQDSPQQALALRQRTTSKWYDTYDLNLIRSQQRKFAEVLRANNIEVLIADNASNSYAQHYTRDIGFVIDDTFIVSRLNSPQRQREVSGIRELISSLSKVVYLDAGTIEGGDVMLHQRDILVGLSEETSAEGVEALEFRLNQLGSFREVIRIAFATRGIVHLDDHLSILSNELALVHLPAFHPTSVKELESRFEIIPATDQEAREVAINLLVIRPNEVVASTGSNRIPNELERRGFRVHTVDFSEVTKLPGAFRCATLPLIRQPVLQDQR